MSQVTRFQSTAAGSPGALLELLEEGLQLWTEGAELCYRAQSDLDPELRKKLSERKEVLLATMAPRTRYALTSYAQKRLWFLDQFEPGQCVYNVPAVIRLEGHLDVQALRQALGSLTERHEALRTGFASLDGEPVQLINTVAGEIPWDEVDLTEVPDSSRRQELEKVAGEEGRWSFDLSRSPLWRARLVRMSETEHVLLWTIHHIVVDAWSLRLLRSELGEHYESFVEERAPVLPALRVHYADFALWQRDYLNGPELESQLKYWKEHMEGAPPMLELATDYVRPATQSYRGRRVSVRIKAETLEKLQALSFDEESTLFMSLLAIYQLLLSRYTGQDEIVVGSPIANRTRTEFEGLAGFFANTLALYGDLSGDPTFRELLARTRKTALGAYGHQDVPFEKLVEELQPDRLLSHNPIFQAMFALQNVPARQANRCGEVEMILSVNDQATAKFDLSLLLQERAGGMEGWIEYSTDLFAEATMARMANHFERLVECAVADPDARLSRYSLMTDAEQATLLVDWSGPQVPEPEAPGVHLLFEAQARRTPRAIALMSGGEQLSYDELDSRSNQLAHYLHGFGVGLDVPVGICLDRSFEMIVAVLATLKAGGACLPLDPVHPRDRLGLVIDETATPVVLTKHSLQDRLPDGNTKLICLDTDWGDIAGTSASPLDRCIAPENLVYILYTSGSTGHPKGVAMPHRALLNLIGWQMRDLPAYDHARTLQYASLGFDVAFQEIFATLSTGGTLVLVEEDVRADFEALLAIIEASEVERLYFPTAALQHLALAAARREIYPPKLGVIIVAGEQLSITEEIAAFFERLPGCALQNHYGPTEAHVVSSYTMPAERSKWPAHAPIGRPISNVSLYTLDAGGQPVPPGLPGELCIGGRALAKGYFNDAEMTGKRFRADPYRDEKEARYYRTGDRARWLSDGNLEFLGRLDQQVKVRGFRIEPGEIESVLKKHSGVGDAAVVILGQSPNEKRLAACVVSVGESRLAAQELRLFLADQLPEYMVPAHFAFLDSLPTTRTGKVDRRALEQLDEALLEKSDAAVSSGDQLTPIQEITAAVWCEFLKVNQVGLQDDFFALGGHSLLAAHVIFRLHEAFEIDIPVRWIFEYPTLARFSEAIEEARRTRDGVRLPPIESVARDEPLVLSYSQERMWRGARDQPGNIVAYLFRFEGSLNVPIFEKAVMELARRHEILRTTYLEKDRKSEQIISPPGPTAFEFVDLFDPDKERSEDEIKAEAAPHIAQVRRPFDLEKELPLRTCVIRFAPDDFVVCFVMHHIVCDGWSMNVFLRELMELYEAFVEDLPSPLPALPAQYADFAAWQRSWMKSDGDAFREQFAYWREKLGGTPVLLPKFPFERPEPAEPDLENCHSSFLIAEEGFEDIKALSRRCNATFFMTLLAAFKATLFRCTGQEEILLGTHIAGRNHPEVSGMIGFFINHLPLLTRLSGDPSFLELIARVRETTLDAFTHQDMPFDELCATLRAESLPEPHLTALFEYGEGIVKPDRSFAGVKLNYWSLRGTVKRKFLPWGFTLRVSRRQGSKMNVGCAFDSSKHDPDGVRLFMDQYSALLEKAVREPEVRLSEIELSPPETPGETPSARMG